jgi:predicted GNAT family acetyltransferase
MTVEHNGPERRFEIRVGEATAVLDYEVAGGALIATHTEVPPALRGRGLAELLVRAMLAWAGEAGLRVEPRCSYVAAFMEKHPELGRTGRQV